MSLLIALAVGLLTACGLYLMLRPRTFDTVLGLTLLSYAVNLFIFSMGRLGLEVNKEPVLRPGVPQDLLHYTDPLPQALVLTAIVITLGTVAFVLAMAHRSWQLNENDDVQDDVEDAAIRRLAITDATSDSHSLTTSGDDDEETAKEEDGS